MCINICVLPGSIYMCIEVGELVLCYYYGRMAVGIIRYSCVLVRINMYYRKLM